MDQTEQVPLVQVEKVDIANQNVTAQPKSHLSQALVAATPIFTILITAISIVFTFCFQLVQARMAARQKDDSEWRAAVEKISVDKATAAIGAFEMQSFLGHPKYGDQARSMEAAMMPAIDSQDEFDVALFNLVKDTNETNQDDIVLIASKLSNRVRDSYSAAMKKFGKGPVPENLTLEEFIRKPDGFFDDQSESPLLASAYSDIYRLESVSSALSSLWRRRARLLWVSPRVSPKDTDLSGIIFINHDFQGVDFSQDDLTNVEFVGRCNVDKDLGRRNVIVDCDKP